MLKSRCAALFLAAMLVAIIPNASQPARADGFKELCNHLDEFADDRFLVLVCFIFKNYGFQDMRAPDASPDMAAVFQMTNLTANLQPGEPDEGGKMTRTVWTGFKSSGVNRIVIHTFGSEIDTVLAAYRGNALSNLVRVAGNDNTPLAGIGNKHSLVQFDTVAGKDYRIQIGSRNSAQGDISLNVYRHPPGGGLSVFLIEYGSSLFNSRDYVCDFFVGPFVTTSCQSAKMIVHNSTSKTLTVTPSTTLGPGVSGGAPFDLAPGALKVVTFTFGTDFDKQTMRTIAGHFILTGREGAVEVAEARHRALVVARDLAARADRLLVEVEPTVQTGFVNEPIVFRAKVTNTSAGMALGCHFRSLIFSALKTTFQRVDPATGEAIGAANRPLDIPPGASRAFDVSIASQSARDAYHFDSEAIADCANHYRNTFPLRAGFDISATGFGEALPSIVVKSSKPAGSILNVPQSGFAKFVLRTVNKGSTKKIAVRALYEKPFDDSLDSHFTAEICRTDPVTGNCLEPFSLEAVYTAKENAEATFSVRVKAPNLDPGFDPDRRRIYVNFKQADAPYLVVGAPSIAVRKQ